MSTRVQPGGRRLGVKTGVEHGYLIQNIICQEQEEEEEEEEEEVPHAMGP